MTEITLEILRNKKQLYNNAYQEHLGLANANRGAEMAIDDLIASLQSESEVGTPEEIPMAELLPQDRTGAYE